MRCARFAVTWRPISRPRGTVSGKIVYDVRTPANAAPAQPGPAAKLERNHQAKIATEYAGPLTGSLTVEDLVLSGDGLSRPIQAPKFTLQPVALESAPPQSEPQTVQAGTQNPAQALAGSVAIPAGGAVPLIFNLRFSLSGYQVAARGQASFARARELARVTGIPGTEALAAFAGEPIAVDLTAEGPWMPVDEIAPGITLPADPASVNPTEPPPENPRRRLGR